MYDFFFQSKIFAGGIRIVIIISPLKSKPISLRSLNFKTDNCTPHFTKLTKRDTNERREREKKTEKRTELSINQSKRGKIVIVFCFVQSFTKQLKIQYVNGWCFVVVLFFSDELQTKKCIRLCWKNQKWKRETNYQLYILLILGRIGAQKWIELASDYICEIWIENKCNVQEK